jgi:rfaE bifunctional protein kinase chain/domain
LLRVDFEEEPDHEVLTAMQVPYERALTRRTSCCSRTTAKGGLTHILRMIGMARGAGHPVLVDPKGSDYSRYAGATGDHAEPCRIGPGHRRLEQRGAAARALPGPARIAPLDALLLTRSEEGMSLFDAAGHMQIPAQAREVFDVTGAGDTVIATLAAMMAGGLSLREAMPVANRAGGIVVGKFGTASVSYDELAA